MLLAWERGRDTCQFSDADRYSACSHRKSVAEAVPASVASAWAGPSGVRLVGAATAHNRRCGCEHPPCDVQQFGDFAVCPAVDPAPGQWPAFQGATRDLEKVPRHQLGGLIPWHTDREIGIFECDPSLQSQLSVAVEAYASVALSRPTDSATFHAQRSASWSCWADTAARKRQCGGVRRPARLHRSATTIMAAPGRRKVPQRNF